MLNTRPLSPTMETRPTLSTKSHRGDDEKNITIPHSLPPEQTVRSVHFSTDENDSQSAPHKELTTDMINGIWYNCDEIQQFKQEVRSIVIRHYQTTNGTTPPTKNEIPELERYGPQRSEYKRFARHHIIQAQKHSRDPNYLRSVARRCTAWARAVATDRGFHDYCAVYDPLDGLLDTADFETIETIEIDANDDEEQRASKLVSDGKRFDRSNGMETKRKFDSSGPPQQNKRQRIS